MLTVYSSQIVSQFMDSLERDSIFYFPQLSHKVSSRPCDMSKAIFSQTIICLEVANAAVASLIKIFVFLWAGRKTELCMYGFSKESASVSSTKTYD